MRSRTLAIGDIHGCASALSAVLSAVNPQPGDLIVTLGDYVDRGPDSRQVVELLLALRERCRLVPLLGNHEIMLLASLQSREELHYWLACGGAATVKSYGSLTNIPDEHLEFLRTCRRFAETDSTFFVHANYRPELPLAEQPEEALFWEHLHRRPDPHFSGKTAVVGHTPQLSGEVLDWGHVLGIDTHCFGSGWLTVLDVDTREIWQANRLGQLREPR